MYRLNHSRYIDTGTKAAADREYWRLRQTPTAKQKKFFLRLVCMCKERGLDAGVGFSMHTRADYSMAIDILKERLAAAGVKIGKPEKIAKYVVEHGTATDGSYYTREIIIVENADEQQV